MGFVVGHGWQRPTCGLCGPARLAAPDLWALWAGTAGSAQPVGFVGE